MFKPIQLLMVVLASASLAVGQDEKPKEEVKPVKPSVKKLDETRFQIGDVTFDKITREIRFPAKVNMSEGQLEYLIVTATGKTHEALLSTAISPTHLNLALMLLRYMPSKELYFLPTQDGESPIPPTPIPAEVKAAARIAIDVEWTDDGKTRRNPINEWIQHGVTETAMPAGPWVYGGSSVENGQYVPESTGDIAAIFLSYDAIINYPGEDNGNDDMWAALAKRVPDDGTNITIIIAPYKNSKPIPKP